MTTYSLDGYGVQSPAGDGPTISLSAETLVITVPESTTGFSYTILDASEPDAFPDVNIDLDYYNITLDGVTYTPDSAVTLEFSIGEVTTTAGTHYILTVRPSNAPEDFEYIFQLGGTPIPTFTSPTQLDSFVSSIVGPPGTAGGAFAPGATISLPGLLNVSVSEDDTIIGTADDDSLNGGAGDDFIDPMANNGFDQIDTGTGNDTIDFSNSQVGSFYDLLYNLANPISVNIDTSQNVNTISAGASGTDTLIDVARAMNFNTGDGIFVIAGDGADQFTITNSQDEWIGIAGGPGVDSYALDIGGTVRISFQFSSDGNATQAADINVATGVIANDGFGNSETLTVTGTGRLELDLTVFADTYVGYAGDERVIPRGGDDTLDAMGGVDLIRYDRRQNDAVEVNLETGIATGNWDGVPFTHTLSNFENIQGSRDGDDLLIGNASDNNIRGRGGNDTLSGNGGVDELYGEEGNDIYIIDGMDATGEVNIWDPDGTNTIRILNYPGLDGGDFYVDGGDLVRVSNQGQVTTIWGGVNSVQFVEWTNTDLVTVVSVMALITDMADATDQNYVFAGTNEAETVTAPSFAADGDFANVYLNGGDDEFIADGGYRLFAHLGSGNDTLTGSAGDDWARGQAGDDSLIGDGGNDTLYGEDGNDTLSGGDGDDDLHAAGSGADIIDGGLGVDHLIYADATGRVLVDLQSDVSSAGFARFFTEGAGSGDTFTGIEEVTGSDFADNLRGDASGNTLNGGGVSDRLYGRAGDDILDGGTGADAIYGNAGADTMTGGEDEGRRDRYIYFQASESGVGDGNRDVITDFVSGEDRIELRRIDADITTGGKQLFTFIGDTAFSGTAGELRYEQIDGNTIVQADRDGDGLADFEIELTGTMTLQDADFFI